MNILWDWNYQLQLESAYALMNIWLQNQSIRKQYWAGKLELEIIYHFALRGLRSNQHIIPLADNFQRPAFARSHKKEMNIMEFYKYERLFPFN